jgi:Sec-independent protein translocase protein TatA
MFDIGWTEIIVVVLVGCFALDIKDLPKIVKGFKQVMNYCNNLIKECKLLLFEVEQETKKIIDLDGNEQLTYDISDMMPDIKKDKDKDKDDKKP